MSEQEQTGEGGAGEGSQLAGSIQRWLSSIWNKLRYINGNLLVQLGDKIGGTRVQVKDTDSVQVFWVDSDGNAYMMGNAQVGGTVNANQVNASGGSFTSGLSSGPSLSGGDQAGGSLIVQATTHPVTKGVIQLNPNGASVQVGTETVHSDLAPLIVGANTKSYPATALTTDQFNILLNGLDQSSIGFHDSGSDVGLLQYFANRFRLGALTNRVRLGINKDPSSVLHLLDAGAVVLLENAATAQTSEVRFIDPGGIKGRLLYAGGNGAGARYFGFINTSGDYLAFFSDGQNDQADSRVMLLITFAACLA